jgi:hypothetical protein
LLKLSLPPVAAADPSLVTDADCWSLIADRWSLPLHSGLHSICVQNSWSIGEFPDVEKLDEPPDQSPPGGLVAVETVTVEGTGPDNPTTPTQYSTGACTTTMSVWNPDSGLRV